MYVFSSMDCLRQMMILLQLLVLNTDLYRADTSPDDGKVCSQYCRCTPSMESSFNLISINIDCSSFPWKTYDYDVLQFRNQLNNFLLGAKNLKTLKIYKSTFAGNS